MPMAPHSLAVLCTPLSSLERVRGFLFFLLFSLYASLSCAASPITMEHPWCRPTMGEGKITAIYLTLSNNSTQDDVLLGVEIPLAEHSSIHNTLTQKDGVMQMIELDKLSLPAGKTLEFAPGGLHIMVTGLQKPLHEGDHFPIILQFRNAGMLEGMVAVTQ